MGMVELKSNLVIERPSKCEWLVRRDEPTFEVDLTVIHRAEARREELVTAAGRGLLELEPEDRAVVWSSDEVEARVTPRRRAGKLVKPAAL